MSNCVDTKELARQLGIIRTKNLAKTMKKDGISKVFQPFDYLVVLDFESTCWKDNKNRPSEIIEFPVVWLDTHTGQILSEFREYVMPMQHPQLSAFCTSLTGITQHQVDSGIPLNIAIKRLQNWASNLCTHHDAIFIHSIASSFKMNHRGVKSLSGNSSLRVDNNNNHANNNVNSNTPRNKSNSNNSHNISCSGWSDVCERKAINTACVVTWSDWDIGVCLAGECHRKCITVPACLNTWVDLRATYKNFYGCKPDGLKGALDRVGLAFEGREHSGLMDSRNTAMLCVRMMKDGCVLQATKSLIPALNLVKLNKFLITWVRERGAVSNDNINNNDNNNNKDNNSNNPNNNHNNKNNDNNNSRDNCKLKDKKRNNKNIINHNRSNKVYAKTCLIDDANGFLDGCRNIKNNNNNNINNKFNNNDSRNNNADINGSIKSIDTNNTNINNDNFDNSNNNHTSSRSNVNNDFKINKNICKKEIFNVIAVNGREDPDLKINNNNNESKFDYKNKSNNTIINNRQTNTSINNNYNTTNKNNNIDESDWIKEDDDDIFNTSLALKFCDDDDVDSFNHFSGGNITSKLEEINDNNTKIFEEKNVEKLKISITINSNEITNNINEIPNNSNKYNIDNNYPKDKSTITRSYNDITNITNKNNKYSNVNNNDNNKCISTTIINDNNTGFSDEEDNDLLAASLLEDEDCHSSTIKKPKNTRTSTHTSKAQRTTITQLKPVIKNIIKLIIIIIERVIILIIIEVIVTEDTW